MKNTPSALKWLAKNRARIAGELQSCNQSIESIKADIDAWRIRLDECQFLEANAHKKPFLRPISGVWDWTPSLGATQIRGDVAILIKYRKKNGSGPGIAGASV